MIIVKKKLKNGLINLFIDSLLNNLKEVLLPDGPKVGSISLSPRGDWRMPSDAAPWK